MEDDGDIDHIAFLCAAFNDGIGLIEAFNERASMNGKAGGVSPLAAAISNDHIAIVCLVVDRGADVKCVDVESGLMPIQCATMCYHLQAVKFLVSHGADRNAVGNTQLPALCYAAEGRFLDMAEFLLSKGADVDNVRGGVSPLSLAQSRHDHKMAALLRHYGAAEE